jgi:hypothetical protein
MSYDFVQNDTASKITVTCRNSQNALINLTGYTVSVHWRNNADSLTTRTMTITNAAGGVAEYLFQAGELEAPKMRLEIAITIPGIGELTSREVINLLVREQIG